MYLLGGIQVIHTNEMVFTVLQLHDLCINIRPQGTTIIWKVRKAV